MARLVLSTSPTFTKHSERARKLLEENNCQVVMIPPKDMREHADFKKVLGEADAWVVGINKVTAADLDLAPNLKLVIKHGTGVDSIDVKAAQRRGIIIANTPGTNADAVADLTMGLALGLARRIVEADKLTRSGFWGPIMGSDVCGKTLGVLGLGQIGRGVVQRARGFNMNVLAYDLVHDTKFENKYGVRQAKPAEIMATADFITVHLPLNEHTRGFIGSTELMQMKRTAFLINICRGGVVDERALYDALKEGKIAGAALDVYQVEPPVNSMFFTLENVIVTPHMGGYSFGAMAATSDVVAQSVINVLNGQPPLYKVELP